jgi:hypothetical protein
MATMTDAHYLITEAQMRTIMRLSDAANMLTAGLPPAYTTTPMGSLKSLSDAVAEIAFSVKPTALPQAAAAALALLEGTADCEDRDGRHNAAMNVREVERSLKAALHR